MNKTLTIVIVITAALLTGVFFRFMQSMHQTHHVVAKSIEVKAALVTTGNFPVFVTAPGSVEASQSAAIQSQVTGVIQKIGFNPGDHVTQGQLLFQIDPSTYAANLAKDQAEYVLAKKDFERYHALVKKGYVSKMQYDQIKAALGENANTIKFDKAQLNYTHITAPISGKTGNITVKEGDLVTANNNQTLVTINQFSPILIDFYLPQAELSQLMHYQNKNILRVESYGTKKQLLDANGTVSFVDNTVNPTTGTILLKAAFQNKKDQLFPGQSVIVKLIFTTKQNTLSIPTRAVQSDDQGNFVYRIVNGRAVVTRITVLRQLGDVTFVKSGLTRGDQIAVLFPPNLTNNALVTIKK